MPKIDREATAKAEFLDRRSYWNVNGHVYLRGKDVGIARLRIYGRDKGHCQLRLEDCEGFADWDNGELEHEVGGLGLQRCWCDHNLRWSCGNCNARKHGRFPRWSKREKVAL